jgi:hypothetical protein
MGRDDHHGHPGRHPQARFHQVQARLAVEPEINQHHVEPRPLHLPQGVHDAHRVCHHVAHRLEGDAQRRAEIRLVVDDQDSHGSTGRPRITPNCGTISNQEHSNHGSHGRTRMKIADRPPNSGDDSIIC